MQTLVPTWNLAEAATQKWYAKLLPSLNDVAFLLPIFILFARMDGTRTLFSDGDTGWHIRTGEWILAHHAIPVQDLFSFTKAQAEWFAWEWLWDVAAALVHGFAGLAGIAFMTTVMLGLFSWLVYRLALLVSRDHVMSIAVTALAVSVSSIHWLARPHLVTWIFTLVFLHVLESARASKAPSRLMLTAFLPVLMVLWTNLHGGFVAGLIILACYGIGEAFTACLQSKHGGQPFLPALWRASSAYWISFAACAIATLINPYGWHLHRHVAGYLSDSALLDKIQEFQSISFHAGPAIFLEIMLLLAILAVFASLRERECTPVLLICLWAHFALQSARHIPLFAIVAAPFAASFLSLAMARSRQVHSFAALADLISDIGNDLKSMERLPRLHMASAAALLLIAGLFAVGHTPFAPEFNPEAFPVQAIALIQQHPGSHVFTSDQWGDYLLYRLYPAERVFFDGRSDFYGSDFVQLNERIASAEHDWKSLLGRYDIDLAVLKPETPLAAVLKLTPGSRVLFDDGRVIVIDTVRIYPKISSRLLRTGESANWTPDPSHVPNPVTRMVASMQLPLHKS